MKRKTKHLIKVIALIAITLFVALSSTKTVNANTTLKAGFFKFDGYHMIDEETGAKSGYGYDILQQIAGYAGFSYEYDGYDKSWSEAQQDLKDGNIDILTSAQMTPERLTWADFSKYSIGTSAAILTVKSGNTNYLVGDYSNWDGMRVGVIENNSRNDDLKDFANGEDGFTYTEVLYTDTDTMINDLQSGDNIDAILTSNLRRTNNETVIKQFESSPFYIMVQKGATELLEQINYAIEQMDINEPSFRTELMNKYYSASSNSAAFNSEETLFINSSKDFTYTAILNPDREPYSYVEDGKLTGVFYDIASEVIRRSGLNISFVIPKDREEYQSLVNSGSVDICFDAIEDYSVLESKGYWITPAFIDLPLGRLRNESTTTFKTVGIIKDSAIDIAYSNSTFIKSITIFEYSSVDELTKAVLNNKIDMAILPLDTATAAVRDDKTSRLISERLYGYNISYAVAIKNTDNPMLYSVIKKTLSSISDEEVAAFSQSYADSLEKPFTLREFIYDKPLQFALILLGISVIITLVVISTLISIRKKKAVVELNETQSLNIKLENAVRKAETADKAKSIFMSKMSHEIRTPLNAVIGYNTIARNEMVSARTDEEHRQAEMKTLDCLTKSDIASKHLLAIINDVLDMSAIESGKIKIANEKFDFKGLITSITTIFYGQAKQKNVELDVVFGKLNEEWFVGDQMRVNQILTNLLSNAIKFTPDRGRVKLLINEEKEDEENTYIHFEISDTGIGMSEEFLSQVWTPFEQADASINRRYGGTGLGLAITKNLVEIMGGNIKVKSELGVGTTFLIDLCFKRTIQPSKLKTYDFKNIRALVIDDDSSTCDYVYLLFTKFGVRCSSFTSSQNAIDEFYEEKKKGDPYNLCLVDWQMPGMDGIETVKKIREIAIEDLPVIIITAYDYTAIADKAAEIGINSFVSKPLFPSSLFNLIAKYSSIDSIKDKKEIIKKYDFDGTRVLLVEDNSMNMEVATRILSNVNIKVDQVWNGEEGVRKFVNSPKETYKVILMDIQMPIMDGYNATRAIRASNHPEAKTIPIIAMSADAFSENVAEALNAGMNSHIAKPIDVDALYKTLDTYLKK